MRIVITGSLGNIGKPLTVDLVNKGHNVVVVTSNQEKEKDIKTLGATPGVGALEDTGFLAGTFRNADAVYAMVPPNFTVPDPEAYYKKIGKSMADALERTEIKRVVLLSSWGAHLAKGTGMILGSYHVEQIFNALGSNVTYLRPASFYYNLLHYVDMIRHAGFIGTNFGGEDKLVMVSPVDIAGVAAEELLKTTGTEKIRYIASDERTCNDVAKILGREINKPDLPWRVFTDQETLDAIIKAGTPKVFAEKIVELNAAIHSGLLLEDFDRNRPAFGKIKIEDYAKEFAAVYNNKY